MNPGRDLDALIAHQIFDLPVHRTGGDWTIGPRELYDDHGSMEVLNSLPEYSTDIAAAWDIVEKLGHFGSSFSLLEEHCGEFGQEGFVAKFRTHDGDWSKVGYSESAPHAICLAALNLIKSI